MTALGAIVLWRTYFSCNSCGLGGYAADRVLGLEGFLTRQATRLICLLGGQNSFAVTERLLKECCGWTISDERIRQACQAESPRIAGFRAESPAVAKAFADAPGDVEFQTDAAKVNTTRSMAGRHNLAPSLFVSVANRLSAENREDSAAPAGPSDAGCVCGDRDD